jgi:hypothetical protein
LESETYQTLKEKGGERERERGGGSKIKLRVGDLLIESLALSWLVLVRLVVERTAAADAVMRSQRSLISFLTKHCHTYQWHHQGLLFL